MDRREALKRTAWIMGGVVSAPAIMGVLKGCAAKPTIDWKPVFLSEDQGILVSEVAEIIIPKTDTPGAKDTGVPGFIDLMLKDVYAKEDQDRFLAGLKEFDEAAQKEYGDPFTELDPNDQTAFVKKIHDAAVEAERATTPAPKRPFILMAKELTMLGFFTSEPGATQVLQYIAVPGSYKGCIPLSEAGNGKTWAT
ncbi:MAG TPA: gluconate 2-dehydrogenase subunit 3 family protein [Chryseolinea sp.]